MAGAPESVGFARMDNGSESDKVDTLIIEGTVTDTEGNIIEGAKVEVWHANSPGTIHSLTSPSPTLTCAVPSLQM